MRRFSPKYRATSDFRLSRAAPSRRSATTGCDGGELRLISRNGHDLTKVFHAPFQPLAGAGLPAMVLDGEIAVPDERGVTHIDGLTEAIRERRPDRLAYFAFDLLHLDGHDLRRCPIEDRKALLRDLIGAA